MDVSHRLFFEDLSEAQLLYCNSTCSIGLTIPDALIVPSEYLQQVFAYGSGEPSRGGVMRALEKRPVSIEEIESALNRITHRLRATGERELPSREVGEAVMAELRSLDGIRIRIYEVDGDPLRVAARMTRMSDRLQADG